MRYLPTLAFIVALLSFATLNTKAASNLKNVPLSKIYAVSIKNLQTNSKLKVFHNTCNDYIPNNPGTDPKDKAPLETYKGYSVDWFNVTITGQTEVVIEVLDTSKVRFNNVQYRVLPSRKNIVPKRIEGTNKIRFTLLEPGQYSIEIGTEKGWKHALLIFANPPETDLPDLTKGKWYMAKKATKSITESLTGYDAIYFKPGIHDIGVFKVPTNIKKIYIPEDAWVYGAIVMEKPENSGVKIFGRGTLSGARLHLRESHSIEALKPANNISISGITIADYVYFAIRLLGHNNHVEWTKIVGGWIYNCDGIAAYAGSKINNCFIWANDDNLKLYDDNITVDDVVCWNLNNGAIFQLSWSSFTSSNVVVRNADIIRTDYSGTGKNHGILNCRTGNGGYHRDYLFENITVETPSNIIINLAPDGSGHPIENFILRNWNVKMPANGKIKNRLMGISNSSKVDLFSFSNFKINDTCLTEQNFKNYFDTLNIGKTIFSCGNNNLLHINDIRIRDPYILTDTITKTYYMYAQTQNRLGGLGDTHCGLEVYTSKDLIYWTAPKLVYEADDDNWANKSLWAPEVHQLNNKYYLFATLSGKDVLDKQPNRMERVARGTSILHADNPFGPFKPFINGPHTPKDQMCLDGTLWQENGRNYMIYCREWVEIHDGSMDLVELSADLSTTISKPQTLFNASNAPWVRNLWESSQKWDGFITDGPFIYKTKSGKLLMIWSSFGETGYLIGIAESQSGSVHGPWIQQPKPLFSTNGGHGMIFKDIDGNLRISLHQPNYNGRERAKIYNIKEINDTLEIE